MDASAVLLLRETQWVEYRRYPYPVPSMQSPLRSTKKENLARRGSRIRHARRLPHFVVFSKSTGQNARIFVEQQNWRQDIPEVLTPDSWGLSRLGARFAVPVIE